MKNGLQFIFCNDIVDKRWEVTLHGYTGIALVGGMNSHTLFVSPTHFHFIESTQRSSEKEKMPESQQTLSKIHEKSQKIVAFEWYTKGFRKHSSFSHHSESNQGHSDICTSTTVRCSAN